MSKCFPETRRKMQGLEARWFRDGNNSVQRVGAISAQHGEALSVESPPHQPAVEL